MDIRGWRRAPRLVVSLALMSVALWLGETPLGWASAALGLAAFVSGSAGLCLGCAVTGCRARPRSGG